MLKKLSKSFQFIKLCSKPYGDFLDVILGAMVAWIPFAKKKTVKVIKDKLLDTFFSINMNQNSSENNSRLK